MYQNQQQNQQSKQKTLKDLNEIKQLKPGRIKETINLVVSQALYFKGNYYESEATIAARLGVSLRTVNRAISKARGLGIILRRRRFNNSNVYAVNPELRNPEIIDELASVLPALRNLLCLSFLIPLSMILNPAPAHARQNPGVLYFKKEILRMISVVQKDTLNEEKNKKLKGDTQSSRMDGNTYGGTGLYDRKYSQAEIDLQQAIHERQKRKYSMFYPTDEEAQPAYATPKISAARQQAYPVNTPYAPYMPRIRKAEDPVQASARLIQWLESEEGKRAEQFFGKDVALKMCNKIVSQAIEEYKE